MLTYSINDDTVSESFNLGSINDILGSLSDNTNRSIKPIDLRNAIFTLWNNAGIFKSTGISSSNVEYIGIDYTQTGINLKQKIYLGKRSLLGSNIMTSNLLNNDTDIFIYNTKSDSDNQDSTKISILAGGSSSIHEISPYIESRYYSGTQSYINLDLKNDGYIDITSFNKGVSINGLLYPSVKDYASASNGYVLKYLLVGTVSYLTLSPIGTANIDTVYSSGTVSISGNPIVVNGYPIEFTNLSQVISSIGGISAGSTFSNTPIVNVLNNLIYPYISASPSMILTASSSYIDSIYSNNSKNIYVEFNSLSSLKYYYEIIKKSYPISSILSSPGGSLPPTTSRLIGTSSISILPLSTQVYTLSVTDGTQSSSITASINYVYPYFWSATSSDISFTSSGYFSSMNKISKSKSDTTISINSSNIKIYFAYPSSYGDLSYIIEGNTGWNYISSFSKIYGSISLTSSSPVWSTTYNIYKYTVGDGTTSINSTLTFKH